MNKVPIQVYLDKNIHEQLRLVAKRQKVSQSDLIRKYLYRGLEKDLGPADPALDIIGLGEGKTRDLAERHDHYMVLREKETWKK